jgi:hypothetical protein
VHKPTDGVVERPCLVVLARGPARSDHAATTKTTRGAIAMMRGVDGVQLHGWTPEAVTQATKTLSGLVAWNNAEPDPENYAVAVELVRWLTCAARAEPMALARLLDDLRPSGANASPWDQLESLLSAEQDIDSLMSRLQERDADPVTPLCLLLRARISADDEYTDLHRPYARALEVLARLGTDQSAEYLIERADLYWWEVPSLDRLASRHRDVFAAAAVRIWHTLSWHSRVLALKFMEECLVPNDGVIALLWTTDEPALTYDERYCFVEALLGVPSIVEDRPIEIVRSLIARCSNDPSHEARAFVKFAREALSTHVDCVAGRPTRRGQRTRAARPTAEPKDV